MIGLLVMAKHWHAPLGHGRTFPFINQLKSYEFGLGQPSWNCWSFKMESKLLKNLHNRRKYFIIFDFLHRINMESWNSFIELNIQNLWCFILKLCRVEVIRFRVQMFWTRCGSYNVRIFSAELHQSACFELKEL